MVAAIFTGVIAAIAITAALTARETRDVPTSQLGQRRPRVQNDTDFAISR